MRAEGLGSVGAEQKRGQLEERVRSQLSQHSPKRPHAGAVDNLGAWCLGILYNDPHISHILYPIYNPL